MHIKLHAPAFLPDCILMTSISTGQLVLVGLIATTRPVAVSLVQDVSIVSEVQGQTNKRNSDKMAALLA